MASRTRHRTTDRPEVTEHAREQWAERGDPARAVDDAWRASQPVPTDPHTSLYCRYHTPTGCLLLARRTHTGSRAATFLVTVLAPEHDPPRQVQVPLPAGGERA